MPTFKSTYNILTKPWEDEVFNPNWMDSDKLVLPPKKNWDYAKPLDIEDINIWEVISENGGGVGVYAAWDPYAEFYLITFADSKFDKKFETYYGAGAQIEVQKKLKELGFNLCLHTHWIEPEDMWLYQPKEIVDLIL